MNCAVPHEAVSVALLGIRAHESESESEHDKSEQHTNVVDHNLAESLVAIIATEYGELIEEQQHDMARSRCQPADARLQ